MSNIVVGEIYRQIVERIVEVSQTDFEENGYAPETLQDLRKMWEENLTKLHVAQMPWEPKQAQPSMTANLSSNIKTEGVSPAPNGDSVVIKQEIKYENGPPEIKYETPTGYGSMNGYAGGGINSMAQQRAANHLRQQFGNQANASIQAAGLPQQPHSQQIPGQQRSQQMANQGQRPAQPNYQNGLGAAQRDGAADIQESWQDIVIETRASASERNLVDGILRTQLDEQTAIEDGGLGLLTTLLSRSSKGKEKKSRASAPGIPQVDGADEDDEDAINSDLDDSEDEVEQEQEDDDGPLGEMILCTWDKVNRVKNKWKCTLKDGVLATGGKEYLFHKATGEFEW